MFFSKMYHSVRSAKKFGWTRWFSAEALVPPPFLTILSSKLEYSQKITFTAWMFQTSHDLARTSYHFLIILLENMKKLIIIYRSKLHYDQKIFWMKISNNDLSDLFICLISVSVYCPFSNKLLKIFNIEICNAIYFKNCIMTTVCSKRIIWTYHWWWRQCYVMLGQKT